MAGDEQRRRRGFLRDRPQRWDVGRVVLPIAIEGSYPGAASRLDAAANGGALATAGAMLHQPQPRGCGLQAADFAGGRIGPSLIHLDDRVCEPPVERGGDLADEWRDVAGLVPDRDDDGKLHATDEIPPSRGAGPLDRNGRYTYHLSTGATNSGGWAERRCRARNSRLR